MNQNWNPPNNWQELVTQALLMYDDVEDIKSALRARFGSGKHGTVQEWYEYLVWLNERREKDRLFKEWSGIWQQAKKAGIDLESIPFDVGNSGIVVAIERATERIENV